MPSSSKGPKIGATALIPFVNLSAKRQVPGKHKLQCKRDNETLLLDSVFAARGKKKKIFLKSAYVFRLYAHSTRAKLIMYI